MRRKQAFLFVHALINEVQICARAGVSPATGAACRAPTKDGFVSLVMRTLMAVCATIVGMSALAVSTVAESNGPSCTDGLVKGNTAFAVE